MTTTTGDPSLELDFPGAFAKAFAPTLEEHGKQFRYVHLSGGLVERDQAKALWVKGSVRKMKIRKPAGSSAGLSCCFCERMTSLKSCGSQSLWSR